MEMEYNDGTKEGLDESQTAAMHVQTHGMLLQYIR